MRMWMWVVAGLVGAGTATVAEEKERKGAGVFGLSKSHPIHLQLTAKDYQGMEPPARQPRFGGQPRRGLPAPGSPDAGVGKFDFGFEYVPADVVIGEETLKKVAVRYKGNGTFIYARGSRKRSVKIDFDRYSEELRLDGLKKINLHCNVTDSTMSREALAYYVFREVGVPACRTAFAEVTLTVPNRYDKELLGLYTLVEQVDKSFLKHHFGSSKGLLLKPEGVKGVPYLGDSPKDFEVAYNPKTEGTEEQWKRLVAFTHLVNKADEATFQNEIGDYLDIDEFVRFLATTTMISTLDSFIGLGHNFYLYLSPKTNKFVFIPWDLDHAFGAFFPVGSTEQQVRLSIDHPHVGDNKLVDRLLAMPSFKKAFRAELERIATTIFTVEKLVAKIAELEKLTKEPIAKDKAASRARNDRGFGGFGGFGGNRFGGQPMTLTAFVQRRAKSVLAQLAGREEGVVLRSRFGGFGGSRPGTGGRPGFGGRPGTGGRPGFGGTRPGFGGPGANEAISKPLLEALDTDKDGKLSEDELTKGMKKLFQDWDKDKSSGLDERELREGLQRLRPSVPRRP